MKRVFSSAAASTALLLAVPVHANQPASFGYKFVTDPVEGPLDPVVGQRYTAQWKACQERAISTRAHETCFAAEFARQDKRLNRTWRLTLARVEPKLRGHLLAAQQKWVSERDPFCRSQSDRFRGGTIVPIVYVDCRVEQTIRRTIWLERLR